MSMTKVRKFLPAFAFLFALLLSHTQNASAFITATGGNATNDFDGKRSHIFTDSSTASNFVVTGTSTGYVELLVVAGGGGGGANWGGGGGAGGLIYSNTYPVVPGTSTVRVGAGGAGAPGSGTKGYNGSNSVFGSFTAFGGGGGSSYDSGAGGVNGGSGGGACSYLAASPSLGTNGQGNAGAGSVSGGSNKGGGGGGAGSTGLYYTASAAGNGGAGLAYDISGTMTNYAGGGGGGTENYVPGLGGSGVGGNGGSNAAGSSAMANTGGGGGGGGYSGGTRVGGSGGSGIVIVRYELGVTVDANEATSLGKTNATLNGYLTYDGGGGATEVAFCYGFTNSGTGSTSDWPNVVNMGGTWTNYQTFSNIVSLLSGSTYVYRAYATNGAGSGWSGLQTFRTKGPPPVATGGNVTNDVNGYRVHLFTNSATASNFVVTTAGDIDALVVAGGGGGGGTAGGGGGAGGLIYVNWYTVVPGTSTVTVGLGGSAGQNTSTKGGNGSNSVLGPFTAFGGGGGGTYNIDSDKGNNGGSGGGAGPYTANVLPSLGTNGQGNAGGGGNPVSGSRGGGGGGAGSTGLYAQAGSHGGAGLAYDISGTSTNYAGGGGGGANGTAGLGGSGVGANGGNNTSAGSSARANTGGGGGGGGWDGGGNHYNGGSGGSGIVIVRYEYVMALTVNALVPTDVGVTNATMNGRLLGSGEGGSPDIAICWGTSDSGTGSTSDWSNVAYMGNSWTNGQLFSNTVYTLIPGQPYIYRCFATNSGASAWSDAVTFTPISKTWVASSADMNWFSATNWSPEGVPADGDAVLISSAYATTNVFLTNSTARLGGLIISGRTMVFSNWTTMLLADNVTVRNAGILTHAVCLTNAAVSSTNRVYIQCTNLTINAGASINVDSRGYVGGQGPGGRPNDNGGAGYGGRGGYREASGTYPGGPSYGSFTAPIDPGSGAGGYGGGAIRIDAVSVTVNGLITASGGAGSGAGSGGGIYVTCREVAGSNGIVRAVGGEGSGWAGGGGGRIAVVYDAAYQAAISPKPGVVFTVAGGIKSGYEFGDLRHGLAGSLYFTDAALLTPVITNIWADLYLNAACTNWNTESLTISNTYLRFPTNFAITVTNDLKAIGAGRMYMTSAGAAGRLNVGGNVSMISTGLLDYTFASGYPESFTIGANLAMTNHSELHLRAGATNASSVNYGGLLNLVGRELTIPTNCTIYPYSQSTNGGSMKMVVSNLVVATGGRINADSAGYTSYKGPGRWENADSSAAGYGGKGGARSGYGGGGDAYGSSNAPVQPGSGADGAGGGLVRVEAAGNISVDGIITADGGWGGGAGSGGGVFLASRTFGGSGAIRANGGAGGWACGGGGRIAIGIGFSDADVANLIAGVVVPGFRTYTNHASFTGTLSVSTNNSNGSPPGNPGTKHFMTDKETNLSVLALSATAIGITNATLNGKVAGDGDDMDTTVTICWGYTNSGTGSTSDWPNVISMGGGWKAVSWFSNTLHALLSGSTYVYRCYATNTTGESWSSTQSFRTISLAGVTNLGYTGNDGVYWLRGKVTYVPVVGMNPYCWFNYWTIGGATSIVSMAQQTNGATFTTNLTGLPLQTAYQYNIMASNEAGISWSEVSDFTTEYYLTTNKVWVGSSDMNWFTSTNWSPVGVPVNGESVLISSAYSTTNILLTNSTALLGQLVISNRSLTFSNAATAISATNIMIRNGGVLTHAVCHTNGAGFVTNRVHVSCSNLTVQAGGKIDVSAKGYPVGYGPGKGGANQGGGGYGGRGGMRLWNSERGQTYGSSNAPIDPGSPGQNNGTGGGVVRIHAPGNVTVNGTIAADGPAGGESTGSGGGIFITCGTFGGGTGGIIRADGGSTDGGGGGGGGRIAIGIGFTDADVANLIAGIPVPGFRTYATHASFMGTLSVSNGTAGYNPPVGFGDHGTKQFMTDRETTLTVLSMSATAVGITNATLNGKLNGDGGDTDTTVAICWGYTNSGTGSTSDWPNVISMGGGWKAVSWFSNTLHALLSGSTYVYRCYATNTTGESWSSTQSFRTISLAGVTNLGYTGQDGIYWLRGKITYVPVVGMNPYCWFNYWTNGGATSIVYMAQQTNGATFATNLTGLPLLTAYEYIVSASNEAGVAWSEVKGFTTEYFLPTNKVWIGTSDMNWFTATNWSPEGVPVDGDSVLISSVYSTTNVFLTNTTAILGQLVISNRTIVFSNWATLLQATNLTIRNGAILTHAVCLTNAVASGTNRVYIQCTNLTVNAGGSINVDSRGFGWAQGPGGIMWDGGGASYGARGGYRDGSGTYPPGSVYGSITAPIHPGSGAGGYGGGAVRIDAYGSVTVNGIITANGAGGGGGSSGGGIYITCRDIAGASGAIRAVGGDTVDRGGGGGGRIAVVYDAAYQAAISPKPGVAFSVAGGRYTSAPYVSDFANSRHGLAGSLYFTDAALLTSTITNIWGDLCFSGACTNWNTESVTISNTYLRFPTNLAVTVTNDFKAIGSARIYMTSDSGAGRLTVGGTISMIATGVLDYTFASGYPESFTIGGNLAMTNYSELYLRAGATNASSANHGGLLNLSMRELTIPTNCTIYPCSHPANGGSIKIVVGSLIVDAGGSINADLKGYANLAGPGKPIGTGDASAAGYGGRGGTRSGYPAGGQTYGSTNVPIDPGSGADVPGGGLVNIDAAWSVTVNGLITANGGDIAGQGGCGSGGGIYINTASGLFGGSAGILRANGGSGGWAGGGGGRIAAWIGVTDVARAEYFSGVTNYLIRSENPPKTYSGSVSVTNGVNGSPPAEPGTRVFFYPIPPPDGTILIIR